MDKIKLNVMIIDDSADDAELIQFWLEELNLPHDVKIFEESASALQHLESLENLKVRNPGVFFPNLILLDLFLPDENGMEVLERIKSFKALRSVPVVLFSASTNPLDIKEAYRRGSVFYLKKSGNRKEFRDLIHQLRIGGLL